MYVYLQVPCPQAMWILYSAPSKKSTFNPILSLIVNKFDRNVLQSFLVKNKGEHCESHDLQALLWLQL